MEPPVKVIVILALASITACVPQTRAETSLSVIAPERSSVVVHRTPAEIAPKITGLFSARGFALAEATPTEPGGMLLHFQGRRPPTANERTLGSAFTVSIEPRGDAAANVGIVGGPMLDDDALCRAAPDGKAWCGEVYVRLASATDGRAEAAVIVGVLAELRVHGDVDTTAVADGWIATTRKARREQCRAERTQALSAAMREKDPQRQKIAHHRAAMVVCD